MTDIPLITLWEFSPPEGTAVRLTSSPPVRVEQTPFPQRGIWIDGNPWYCCGITATGIERATGTVPTITIRIQLTEYVKARKKLIFIPGTRITRYETDVLAVDGSNWSSGTNSYGTQNRRNHRTDVWIITRILDEAQNELSVAAQEEDEFWNELVRPETLDRCYHKYRGNACGYSGSNYWDAEGKSVSNKNSDVCGLRLSDCKLRFPTGNLPFGEG